MRNVALLTLLLLLAFQDHVQTFQETADQVPAQDAPGTEDQDMAIAFTEEGRVTREAPGPRKVAFCTCQQTPNCTYFERPSESCNVFGSGYKMCCH